MKQYDLIVIGGGFSGVCAAIAAARGGVKVLLADKSNCLGGAAMNCLVNPFTRISCQIDGEKVYIAAGIFQEIREKLMARDALEKALFKDEELKQILNDMAREAGVDLLFHAYLTQAKREGDRVVSATFSTVAGSITLSADYFIDATGDAQLSFLAGIPTKLGRESDSLCQPMTLCFRVGGVDVETFFAQKDEMNLLYAKKQAEGEIKNPRENILAFHTLLPGVVHFNTTRVVMKNPTDPWEVTEAELIARDQMFEVFDFMKKYAKGMEHAFLMNSAMEIGVRESRMIVGDYVLTVEDLKSCKKFDDGIAASNYDIDIHNPEGTGTSHHYFAPGEYYTIPYRSLIPVGVENMLVAGRCISSDHEAQASYRVMTVVSGIGQAAGEAMALAVRDRVSVRGISVDELQHNLKAHGAFVDKLRGE